MTAGEHRYYVAGKTASCPAIGVAVTIKEIQAALLALTDDERARLREEALANSHLLTLDQQGRLRATMAVAEQALFTQLLAEAEHRDTLAAREQARATVQNLRRKLAKQLQESS